MMTGLPQRFMLAFIGLIMVLTLSSCANRGRYNRRTEALAQSKGNFLKKNRLNKVVHRMKPRQASSAWMPDYYLVVHFFPKKIQLPRNQQQKINVLISKLGDPKKYIAELYAGAANKKLNMKALVIAERRLRFIKALIKQRVKKVEMNYDPRVTPNEVAMRFVTSLELRNV